VLDESPGLVDEPIRTYQLPLTNLVGEQELYNYSFVSDFLCWDLGETERERKVSTWVYTSDALLFSERAKSAQRTAESRESTSSRFTCVVVLRPCGCTVAAMDHTAMLVYWYWTVRTIRGRKGRSVHAIASWTKVSNNELNMWVMHGYGWDNFVSYHNTKIEIFRKVLSAATGAIIC
jgi:hypothetical protein